MLSKGIDKALSLTINIDTFFGTRKIFEYIFIFSRSNSCWYVYDYTCAINSENINKYYSLTFEVYWLYTKRECLREVKFWKNYTACEELKAIALRHLIIPATSVPSERINSNVGNTITHKRARLKPDLAEKLVFFFIEKKYLIYSNVMRNIYITFNNARGINALL